MHDCLHCPARCSARKPKQKVCGDVPNFSLHARSVQERNTVHVFLTNHRATEARG